MGVHASTPASVRERPPSQTSVDRTSAVQNLDAILFAAIGRARAFIDFSLLV